jgi:hypothetical protein
MKDIEMTLNWIKAWALALAVAPVAFVAVYVVYGLALRSYGLLPGGGAL